MKIRTASTLNVLAAKPNATSLVAEALKTTAVKIVATPQTLPAVIANRNPVPNAVVGFGKNGVPGKPGTIPGLGNNGFPGGLSSGIPGLDKNGLPGRPGRSGLPGGLAGGIPGLGKGGFLGGLGKSGLPGGFGKSGMPGGLGQLGLGGYGKNGFGGFAGGMGGDGAFGGLSGGLLGGLGGGRKGPALKTPGSDRMDGDFSFGGFGKGTWDFGPGGLKIGGSGGVTVGGYGIGVNDKGQVGVAKGDAWDGGSVTSVGDAKAGAASAVNGGSKPAGSGAPEGLEWSRGTRVKDNDTMKSSVPAAPKSEGPNDLGPTNNDPAAEPKKENETAVAKNDTPKKEEAGKPNPFAMPNPEDSGGGSPRSNLYSMPNPEDSGGGTPRSATAKASTLSRLYMPNPEDSGGGTPRSAIANIAAKMRLR
jgi:hypothetical protein